MNLPDYISQQVENTLFLPVKKIELAIQRLETARLEESFVYIIGNGGSSSTASHFACDLNKGTIKEGKPRFKALCLNDNIPVITAWANDTNYNNIFAGQLENFVKPDDILIAISVGGDSPNVVKAAEVAKSMGAYCIGIIGANKGKLGKLANLPIIIPCNNTEQVEDLHLLICHAITTCLKGM